MNERIQKGLAQIDRQYGKGSIFKYGDGVEIKGLETISTGSLSLDIATGIMGLPRGRIVEIFGPESGGKTTLTLHVIAEAQKAGLDCAFIDAEHALDPSYAQKIGVNMEELLISQPDYGEMALDIAETLILSGVPVIVVDSVAALVPKSEIEGEYGDAQMGVQARMMSQAMRKVAAKASKADALVIFINQIREKIGVMFGNPETTTGGRALKFYSSLRLDIRRIGSEKDGEEVVGNKTKIVVVKNKCAPPFKKAETVIVYGQGIDKLGEVVDMAVKYDIIEKSGTWYSYQTERMGQGRQAAKQYLSENEEVLEGIVEAIDNIIRGPALSTPKKAKAKAKKKTEPEPKEVELNEEDLEDADWEELDNE